MGKEITRKEALAIANQPTKLKRTISDESLEKMKRAYNTLYNDYEDKLDIAKDKK